MLLPLCYYGNPLLRKTCKPVGTITPAIRQLASDMIETMDASNGVGLAAPQVGVLLRLFVLRNYIVDEKGEWTLSEPHVFINPHLSNPAIETLNEEEGCLSLPGFKRTVTRPAGITIEALDLEGRPFKEELTGFNARVRMHENDHLNGILFIDRLDKKERLALKAQLKAIQTAHKG